MMTEAHVYEQFVHSQHRQGWQLEKRRQHEPLPFTFYSIASNSDDLFSSFPRFLVVTILAVLR